jgi:hypothetical protein
MRTRALKVSPVDDNALILDCFCCHITQHLLLQLGVYLVGDGNDIRQ